MRLGTRLVVVLGAGVGLAVVRASVIQTPRMIQVQATLSGPDGPIEKIPVAVVSRLEWTSGRTDGAGQVSISTTVQSTEQIVYVLVVGRSYSGSQIEQGEDPSRYTELMHSHFVPHLYPIALQADQNNYSVSIVASPSVQATGRVVDELGQPRIAFVSVFGGFNFVFTNAQDGTFVLRGVPRGVAARVFISTGATGVVKVVELAAHQTVEDIALGDVTLPDLTGTASIRLTATNRQAAKARITSYDTAVTFASNDGTRLLVFPLDANGVAMSKDGGPTTISLPAGTYYIVPGTPTGPAGEKLYRLIRQGTDLSASTIERVVATDGQTTERSIDAAAAVEAVLGFQN